MLDDYIKIGEIVGRGSTCKVMKALAIYDDDNDIDEIALKVYNKKSLTMKFAKSEIKEHLGCTQLDLIKREITIWQQLEHENIIKIFKLYDKITENEMYLVMELGDCGAILSFDEENFKFKLNKEIYNIAKGKLPSNIPTIKQGEAIAKWIFKQIAYGI